MLLPALGRTVGALTKFSRKYLLSSGDAKAQAAAEKATATRNDLLTAAQSAYSSASSAGGDKWSSATSYLAQATADAKHRTFETWSESELKSYLDSYGVVRFSCPPCRYRYQSEDV